jgi:hypothetical protein
MRTSTLLAVCGIAASISLSAQPPQFTRTDYNSSTGTRGIVAVDMDRDGRLDLVTSNSDPDTVTVLHNEGSAGGFRVVQELQLFGGGFGIAAADLNREDIPDVVIANADGNDIAVLRGRADGTLDLPQFISAVGYPRDVTIGDINGDGWLDIVYSAFYTNEIVVLLANGFGGFDSRYRATPVGVRPQGVAAGDFNRDGLMDVVVANTGANLLMLMLGDGTGNFTRTDVPGPQSLNEVVAADLDRDGWLDVAAVSTTDNTITVYRGGPSGLSLTYTGGTGASPRGVAAGDLNGDGRLDVVTANRDVDSVTILMGRADPGTLNFDRTDLPAADGSRGVDVGDFDTDGRLDFAVGNQFAGTVSVFSTQTAPDPGPAEIVLYAHRGLPHGAWRTALDATAADGMSLWHPNAGAPKITAPQSNPANYFEIQFAADPSLSYKLWLRLKAERNYWGNDSVFVQFSGAANESGTPVHRIGTTSGLAVNLEECNNCGVSGWGWRDDAWGTAGAISDTVVQFPAGGTQRIRIQTREDGVMIDQIVLSSGVYRSARPGTTRNDTTILPRSQ